MILIRHALQWEIQRWITFYNILNGQWDENEEFIIYQFYELPCLIAIDGMFLLYPSLLFKDSKWQQTWLGWRDWALVS